MARGTFKNGKMTNSDDSGLVIEPSWTVLKFVEFLCGFLMYSSCKIVFTESLLAIITNNHVVIVVTSQN